MKMPPLLEERNPGAELALVAIVPAIYGAVCGVLLGVDEIAYTVLALLGIIGGYFAGLEHSTPATGAYRGLMGGMIFGVSILLAHGIFFTDEEPKAELPHPEILLVVITTAFGVLLGALGARRRARHDTAAGSGGDGS